MHKARQTRFSVSHQPLTQFVYWVGGHYLLFFLAANVTYTWQIYSVTAIKSGRIVARKAIMTVEAVGLRESGH